MVVNNKIKKKRLKYRNKYGSGIGELLSVSRKEKEDIINKNNEEIEKKNMGKEDTKKRNIKAILSPGETNTVYVDKDYDSFESPMKVYRKAEKENFRKKKNIKKIEDKSDFETSDDEGSNQDITELNQVLKIKDKEIKKLKQIIIGMQKIVHTHKKEIYELRKENARLKVYIRSKR